MKMKTLWWPGVYPTVDRQEIGVKVLVASRGLLRASALNLRSKLYLVSRGDLQGEGDEAGHHQRPDQAQVELRTGPGTVSTR